jgi:hypothetical protein
MALFSSMIYCGQRKKEKVLNSQEFRTVFHDLPAAPGWGAAPTKTFATVL